MIEVIGINSEFNGFESLLFIDASTIYKIEPIFTSTNGVRVPSQVGNPKFHNLELHTHHGKYRCVSKEQFASLLTTEQLKMLGEFVEDKQFGFRPNKVQNNSTESST
jgi:hypothetical protein